MLCYCYYLFFFFFKQKTAYEMRISDWSSDVCSSDLPLLGQLLDALLQQDRIVVVAMPPDGRIDGFPAATPGVIVVRSAQASAGQTGVMDAPGEDILTTQPDGRYDFESGSSLAAAHVSGIAALLLSLSPDIDSHAVRRILRRSSTTPGGSNVVNAAEAIAALNRKSGV